jgi:YVTN family beta-propeller protein
MELNSMKNLLLASILLGCSYVQAQTSMIVPGKIGQTGQVLLPNGWRLSPAGRTLALGAMSDLPLNLQISRSGRLMAITNNGQSTQSVQLIDPKNEKVLDEKEVKRSWYGIAFSPDEKHLYASGGYDNYILDFPVRDNKLETPDTIRLSEPYPMARTCPTGMVTDKSGKRLFVVSKGDSTLFEINTQTRAITKRVALQGMGYSCLLSPDEKKLYISLWTSAIVAVYDVAGGVIGPAIETGQHPNELLLNKKGTRLFVANANDNSVSIIDTKAEKVMETVSTTLYPTRLAGSTTNGLALSADEKRLYIANADNNCLAVFDISSDGNSKSLGFIPVGWYPTNVKTLNDKIIVANGKGISSFANPAGPQPFQKENAVGEHVGPKANNREQYIGGLFKGVLCFIDKPDEMQLKAYTQEVYANTPFTDKKVQLADGEDGNPIPRKAGDPSPIKHVFYIIKENRTYDQVLGDITEGNGDTSLCLFPEKITPNQHFLARNFVLLDNFYVDAEVSEDGHNWSMGAYATDVIEKTWPTNYSSRGPGYGDYGGAPNDGWIWDDAKRTGISYRTYGEFGAYGKAAIESLKGHSAPYSPGFDMKIQDQVRADAWIRDFDSLVAAGVVPALNTIRVSDDHTSGLQKGQHSPIAAVADNDLAVGRIIEHLSQSPVWASSVVFILEDDAQSGPDHIDAHRSPVYVVGPFVKRNTVNHTMYSTSGVLRTIELILGMPPMSQYDAAALPLYGCFTSTPDNTAYAAIPAKVDINERNVADNESSRRSAKFDLAKEDAVPDKEMNEVIWKAVKGESAVMPAPKRSAFVILEKKKDAD